MKKIFLLSMLIIALNSEGQERKNDSLCTTIFSLTPRTSKELKVNGIAIGAGLNISENNSIQKINGLNIEVNPLSLLILMFADPEREGFSDSPTVFVNGLSIGTGHSNQNEDIAYSGLEISLFNASHSCNGVSVNGIYNYASKLNGIHISTLLNYSKNANGLFVSISNHSEKMNGFQLGVINYADDFKGLQIGVFNRSKQQKGLQIGFWNINAKRSMPFINW